MKKNLGQKILKKAKKIIPGGNQLLSKRSEMFLPDQWPNYYKKSQGCEIWDLENKKYYDFAGMGVTACTLGYANKKINSVITKAFKSGNLTTLNSVEEVELARLLIRYQDFPGARKIYQDLNKILATWQLTQEELFVKTREIHNKRTLHSDSLDNEVQDWN